MTLLEGEAAVADDFSSLLTVGVKCVWYTLYAIISQFPNKKNVQYTCLAIISHFHNNKNEYGAFWNLMKMDHHAVSFWTLFERKITD